MAAHDTRSGSGPLRKTKSAAAQDWRIPGRVRLRHFRRRGVGGFVLLRGQVTQGLMDTVSIMEHLDRMTFARRIPEILTRFDDAHDAF